MKNSHIFAICIIILAFLVLQEFREKKEVNLDFINTEMHEIQNKIDSLKIIIDNYEHPETIEIKTYFKTILKDEQNIIYNHNIHDDIAYFRKWAN